VCAHRKVRRVERYDCLDVYRQTVQFPAHMSNATYLAKDLSVNYSSIINIIYFLQIKRFLTHRLVFITLILNFVTVLRHSKSKEGLS
jgi:hypothetical protein